MLIQKLIRLIPQAIKKQIPGSWKHGLKTRLIGQIPKNKFDELATKEDVYYCYRLFLGRNPDPDGWHTYMAHILKGEKVHSLVSMFLASPEFKNRKIFQSNSPVKYVLVELDNFKLYVSPDDWAVGRTILEKREYEPHVTATLRKILEPGMVFVDVGANIGYFSLMAAQIVGNQGRVISFEPNQHNCGLLYSSAQSNNFENIDIYPYAVAEKEATFLYDPLASNGIISDFGRDLEILDAGRILVRSVTLDKVLQGVRKIHVIKLDVEGAEYKVIQGARNLLKEHRPILFSEFSPGGLQNVSKVSGKEYLRLLIENNYHISIIPDQKRLIPCKDDFSKILYFFEKSRSDHIDIVAHPQ
ncbi:MAG TPA: FkbM family methyltransferase [Candidatus Limnocylindrales bacterium]|nr:FkbM family methyltransferase [Candidatus Limnocylindrales bacterium]